MSVDRLALNTALTEIWNAHGLGSETHDDALNDLTHEVADRIERALSGVGTGQKFVPAKWHEVKSDSELGDQPTGDTIRLTWEDGTVLIGRLTVPSIGSGHQQIARMQTPFGGDTYVWPHGSTLEVLK